MGNHREQPEVEAEIGPAELPKLKLPDISHVHDLTNGVRSEESVLLVRMVLDIKKQLLIDAHKRQVSL